MLCGYHARWAEAMADYEVAFVEAEFRAPRLAEVARENYADR